MYLEAQELNTALYQEIQVAIQRSETETAESAINNALALIQAKLSTRYNIQEEYTKNGNQRNGLLVMMAKDIAIYYLYKLPESMPAKRKIAYDNAIDLLLEIQEGKSILAGVNAALKTETPLASDRIATGTRPQRGTYF